MNELVDPANPMNCWCRWHVCSAAMTCVVRRFRLTGGFWVGKIRPLCKRRTSVNPNGKMTATTQTDPPESGEHLLRPGESMPLRRSSPRRHCRGYRGYQGRIQHRHSVAAGSICHYSTLPCSDENANLSLASHYFLVIAIGLLIGTVWLRPSPIYGRLPEYATARRTQHPVDYMDR